MYTTSPDDDKLQMSKSIDGCLKYFFPEKNIFQETIGECFCLYAPQSCLLFVSGADDDATTCVFSRGCCEINGTAVKAVCGGQPH